MARAGLALAAVAASIVLLAGVETALSYGRIHPRVRVGEVHVGGMTREEAAERLEASLADALARPVKVLHEDRSWVADPERLGVRPDAAAAVRLAYGVGRTGTPFEQLGQRWTAWTAGAGVRPEVLVDTAAMGSLVASIAAEIDVEPEDAVVRIQGTDVSVVSGAVGVKVRTDQAAERIRGGFASVSREVTVPVGFVPVRITDADAERAAEQARTMLDGDLTFVHDSRRWTYSPEDISPWIAFREPAGSASASSSADASSSDATGEAGTGLEAYVAPDPLSKSLASVMKDIGRPAVDARFSVAKGKVTISKSEIGTGLDSTATAAEAGRVLLEPSGERTAELRLRQLQPARTTEQAEAMGVKESIGAFRTTYASGARARVNNIHTLADAIDGVLLAPGETFSFNGTVGPRTAAKGYQEAPAIVNGKLVPQLGGGICQVGTTFFNAVFFAGLPVVERTNHSFYISHYPLGRDATVSWGGPDLKFKNDLETWVLIDTSYTNSSLTIDLYSTDPGYDVEYETGPWTDPKPFRTVETKDPTLAAGTRVIEDGGVRGGTVRVKRRVFKGGKLVREDTFVSKYRPKDEAVRVGTGE